VFRLNAGPQVGFGHLMRCRSLAYALREQGHSCVMVGPDQAYAKKEDKDLFDAWLPQAWSNEIDDATRLSALAAEFDAKMFVLDDYRVDEQYQLLLRSKGLKWLQFEARTSQPIWADIVLNASPGARAEDYAPVLRNPETRLLLGPKYAVLRPEFSNVTPRNPERPVKKVLVTFGGGDDRGAIRYVLSALLPVTTPDINFLVISGKHNPRNAANQEWIEAYGKGRVEFIVDPQEIAPLMIDADLAIMAGGTSTYEAVCCGLPMIMITIAGNQERQAQGWEYEGVGKYAGKYGELELRLLKKLLWRMARDQYLLSGMREKTHLLVDGFGGRRIAGEIINKIG